MKKLTTKVLGLGCILLLILSSCKKDGALVVATSGTAGALTASTTTPILSTTRLADTTKLITFSFTGANFGSQVVSAATLQIDKASDNFANPVTVAFSNGVTSQSYNTADFNNLVLKLGISGGTTGQVVARISYSMSSTVTPVYSNVVTLTVTPFNLTSWIYVVGAFQGWNASAPDSLISATGNGIYTGIINFTAGNNQFLILPAKNYNNKYATSQTSTPTSTVTYNASNNLIAPATAGMYIVTYNQTAGTITFTAADFYTVIGDAAQGWSTDLPMKYVNDGTGTWTLTLPLVSTGSFKIRQDDAWTYSWGIPSSGSAGYGIANTLNDTTNGNISIAVSGNYKVNFIAPETPFGTPVGTASGNNPIITTTYSAVKQ